MNFDETVEAFSESLADLWKVHAFREGNTRTTITFCCQFADEFIGPIDKDIFKDNAEYTRRALVAYNAYFSDGQDFSKKEYLERIVADAFRNLKPIKKRRIENIIKDAFETVNEDNKNIVTHYKNIEDIER